MELDLDSISNDDVIVSSVRIGISEMEWYRRWILERKMASMAYMSNPDGILKREDPSLLMEGAKTLIMFLLNYKTKMDRREGYGRIANYAAFPDYHKFFPELITSIILENGLYREKFKVFVDTSPVLERYWAEKSGLGWIGKNSMLVNEKIGSFTLLGGVTTDISLGTQRFPPADLCGKCTRCIESCPTGAIDENRSINSNLCIAYHTIENKGIIPKSIALTMGDMIFGCDICNDVCPWNSNKRDSSLEMVNDHKFLNVNTLEELVYFDREKFKRDYGGSAITRVSFLGLARNALIALYNRDKDDSTIKSAAKDFRDLRAEQLAVLSGK